MPYGGTVCRRVKILYPSNVMIEETKNSAIKRLQTLEGQIRGVSKMIDKDRECIDVLTQIAALRAALDTLGSLLLTSQMEQFITTLSPGAAADQDVQNQVAEFHEAVTRFLR
jgi:CsoR family transcriptional regulator, copper-sensing transcriptional repressor